MSEKTVTLGDVAAVAGVSRPTVSRVLNGQGRVSEATRQRILEAAERLDFRPNALAKFFATGRSQTIGILTENAPGAYTMPVLTGAVTALGRLDMAALVYDAHFDAALLRENVRSLRARQIDGVLVIGDGGASALRSVSSSFAVPAVYAYGFSSDPADTSFLHDGEGAGRLAGEHLLEVGRTRIAHITGPPENHSAIARARGLAGALERAGVGIAGGAPLWGDWTSEWGRTAAAQLLDRGVEFDGIFCGNDNIAGAVIDVLRERGRTVPDDVAVVGMDNVAGMMGQNHIALTTIDPGLVALGAAAAEHLVAAPGGEPLRGIQYQACHLVVGASTVGPAEAVRARS